MDPAKQLAADGYAVIPHFLDSDAAAELRAIAFAVYARMAATSIFLDADFESNFRIWNGVWLGGLKGFLTQRDFNLSVRYQRILAIIANRARHYFGLDWNFYAERSFFRRHVGMSKKVPWHIDADAAAAQSKNCFNLWLPLQRVGDDFPSLEIAPRSHLMMRKMPLLDGDSRYRDEGFISQFGKTLEPTLNLGDALAFDQYTLHRTQIVSDPNIERTSCEFRFSCEFLSNG